MYLANICVHPGCRRQALSDINANGELVETGRFCLEHSDDPDALKGRILRYIDGHDKIVGLTAAGISFDSMEDVNLTSKRFYGCNFMHCVFRGFHSRGFRSRMSTFDFSIFSDCNLLGSNLQYTSFAGCKFIHVLFTGSELIQNNFEGLESFQSSFDDSDLYNSRFIRAKLIDTSIRNCNIRNTVFRDIEQTNLSLKQSNTNEAIFDERGSALFTGMKELDNPVGALT